jgi:hypothetical protein
VSAWEAIKAISRQVHCGLLYGEKMDVLVFPYWGAHPPPDFYRSRNITVHLHSVTAREAFCETLRQSVLPIGITYSAFRNPGFGADKGMSLFEIRFFTDGKQIKMPRDLPKPPDEPNFTVERQEAQQPAEDCGDAETAAAE